MSVTAVTRTDSTKDWPLAARVAERQTKDGRKAKGKANEKEEVEEGDKTRTNGHSSGQQAAQCAQLAPLPKMRAREKMRVRVREMGAQMRNWQLASPERKRDYG